MFPTAQRDAGWTDNRCGTCHPTDALFSHPIGVAPSMAVPKDLPLELGLMTCVTCHDDQARAHVAARTTHTPLLRNSVVDARQFCLQCHDSTAFSRAAQHATTLGRAHRTGDSDQTNLCLSCHDGVVGSDVAVSAKPMTNSLLADHPIGSSMNRQARGNPDANLRFPLEVDRRIRLFDDRIGCTSCHSPYSSQPKLLVMSNRHSELCLGCHIQ
jgi:predicted CXXCH cytochrome family protein